MDRLDIYETLNGGAVVYIKVESPNGQWITIYSGPASVYQESRIFTPEIQVIYTYTYTHANSHARTYTNYIC
jgi:hypothetical protein